MVLVACDGGDSEDQNGQVSETDSGGTGAAADESTSAGAGELPSAYADGTAGDGDGEMPSMDPQDAAASAMVGIATFMELQPDAVLTAFESLAGFEEGCPEELNVVDEENLRVVDWYSDGCTTSAGLEIRGGGRFERYSGRVEGETTTEGGSLYAEGGLRLESAEGLWFELQGGLEFQRGVFDQGVEGFMSVFAQTSADPETAQVSPLLDPSVVAQGQLWAYSVGDFRLIGGSGALTGGELGGAVAMSFDELAVFSRECVGEPAGALAVRDEHGFWHDIVFDGASRDEEEDDWVIEDSLCDGCGTYLSGGAESGTACVDQGDVDALVSWEGLPW